MTVLDQFRVDGDVALVTGAASGIGAAYAEAMAEAGADVALADIDESGLADTAADLRAATDATVLPIEADVTEEADCERMVERTVDELGGLDACFANAGISGLGNKLTNVSLEDWREINGVNLDGVFLTTKAAGTVMEEQGHGRLVVTASMLSFVAEPAIGIGPYVASKGGAKQLTKQLAAELAPAVRVNAVCPGYVRTSIGHGLLSETAAESPAVEDLHDQIEDRTPLGRFAQPAELKGIALYLASEASSYCTGSTFVVDGGWTAI
ncbi:SDR family NAD(P)-dependent oxidoreductase [Halorientalis halophila]|uniref:SDR family NAD(P)-dependent oxidoreductase n=1 Tax=Halorientalis halophila TaxID=3108499 RepID=UPI00300A3F5D